MRGLLICVGLLIAGGFMVYDKSNKLAVMKKLEAEGISTKGIPLEKYEKRGRRSGTTYYVKFEYPTNTGKQTAELDVEHPYYISVKEGTLVNLRYLANDPKQVMIDGQPLATEGGYFTGVALLVAGLIGTGVFAFIYFNNRTAAPSV